MAVVELSKEGRVATLTLNRPEFANAFATESYGMIRDYMEELGQDRGIGSIVITGKGRFFSAGGDIQRFKELIESKTYLQAENIVYAGQMAKAIRQCPKPVIAMINGAAAGAGLSCVLACDYRIVTPSTKMVMAFVNMGLCGDTGSILTLTKLVGVDKASKIMMTGEPVKGEEAVRIGLASMLAEDDKLAETTYAFANKLANKSTRAIAAQKKLIYKYFYGMMDEFFQDESEEMAALSRECDFEEAVYAFLEKRPAVYNKR